MAEWATGFPSYNCMIPKSSATMAATLKGNGYATSWFGKNHNTPDWESSVAGPFDRWPTGMGYEYFYGFIGGEAHQYYPAIFENTKAVEPLKSHITSEKKFTCFTFNLRLKILILLQNLLEVGYYKTNDLPL